MDKTKIVVALCIASLTAAVLILMPKYKAWTRTIRSRAELREAEHEAQLEVVKARATRQSARILADAEAERARGIASANRIIGESLRDDDKILRYLWIAALRDAETIYVPTEASMQSLGARQ